MAEIGGSWRHLTISFRRRRRAPQEQQQRYCSRQGKHGHGLRPRAGATSTTSSTTASMLLKESCRAGKKRTGCGSCKHRTRADGHQSVERCEQLQRREWQSKASTFPLKSSSELLNGPVVPQKTGPSRRARSNAPSTFSMSHIFIVIISLSFIYDDLMLTTC